MTPASVYGEIVYLMSSETEVNPFKTDEFMKMVSDRLESHNYDPAVDKIAVTGPALHVALLIGVVMGLWEDPVVILYEAASSQYRERVLSLAIFDEVDSHAEKT
jgi:hypothetical protein